MPKTRVQVNESFHGPVDIGHGASAEYVIAHAIRQQQRGRNPSVSYKGIRNAGAALEAAQTDIAARAGDTGLMRYTEDFSGRVAVMHVWHENQIVPATSYANARIEDNGAVGAIIQVDMPDFNGRPVPRASQPNGTVELAYHFS